MPTVTSMLSRNCAARAGMDSTPQSGPARSPAKKLSPTSATPESRTAATNDAISASPGTGSSGQGHQNSIASNPASLAARGRSSSGCSVKSIEQFARYGRPWSAIGIIFRIAEILFH